MEPSKRSFDTEITKPNHHAWWTDHSTSGWDRAKEAFRRDWEQTKADLSLNGKDLKQDIGDTLMQSVGGAAIPPRDLKLEDPTTVAEALPSTAKVLDDWAVAEREASFGFAARTHYPLVEKWDDDLEIALRSEWAELKDRRPWEEARAGVRRGWNFVKEPH